MFSNVVLLLAAAASPAIPLAQPATQTVQQAFDAASTLFNAKDHAGALAAYKALEARLLASGKNRSSLALVRLRLGSTHLALYQFNDAQAALRAGLAELPLDNANFAEDRLGAQLDLAQLLEYQLDHSGAAELYRMMAQGKTTGADAIRAQSGIARTTMFSDGTAALKAANSALAAVTVDDKNTTASLLTLRGRVLMNLKRFPEAYSDMLKSTEMLGGMTLKVDFRDLQARSDLAIVSMLMNKQDKAREYLAYTGAGRFDAPLIAAAGDPPTCGGTPNINPNDMAIVNFTIGSDGTVGTANTVYATNPVTALSFADAVRSWSWSPEMLAKIPALFRASTRIELRCTKSISSLDTRQLLDAPLQAWMREKGLKPFDPGSRPYAAWIDQARTELLARRRASGAESLEQLPVLFAISDNPMASGPEMIDAATTVQRLVMANAAPPAVKAAVLLTAGSFMVQSKLTYAQASKGKLALLNSALADTTLANDRQAGPALLLVKADVARRTKDVVSARDALDRIVAFPGLADNDPVKVGALIRIASMNAAAGNVDAARAAFEKTGLTESQCALVDAKPVMTGGSMSDADFPREAMQWGFSGFAVTEFDIDSLGKPVGIRTTIAYPPLIFGPATNKGAARFRYQQSFRPNGGLGCTGQSQRVAYRIPK